MNRERALPLQAIEWKAFREVIRDRQKRAEEQPLDALKENVLPSRRASFESRLGECLESIERRRHEARRGDQQPDATLFHDSDDCT